jgi:hypothetical protein
MTSVIRGLKLFAPLQDHAAFARAAVVVFGSGIKWSNGLDYSSESLVHLAAEQSQQA